MKLTLAVALTLGLACALTEADAALTDWTDGLFPERRAKKEGKKKKAKKEDKKKDTKKDERKKKEDGEGEGPPAARAGQNPDLDTSVWGSADPTSRQGASNRASGGLCRGNEIQMDNIALPTPKEGTRIYVEIKNTCGFSAAGAENGEYNSCNCFQYNALGEAIGGSGCCMNMWSQDSYEVEGWNAPNPANGQLYTFKEKPYFCMSFTEGGKGDGVTRAIESSCLPVARSDTESSPVPGTGGGLGTRLRRRI